MRSRILEAGQWASGVSLIGQIQVQLQSQDTKQLAVKPELVMKPKLFLLKDEGRIIP